MDIAPLGICSTTCAGRLSTKASNCDLAEPTELVTGILKGATRLSSGNNPTGGGG